MRTCKVAQTRIGLRIFSAEMRLDGKLGTDFVDFTKASPTTTAVPRLRRAFVEYTADES